jgi:3-oxoacyl-[acyl-carrier protein] reductase
MTRRVLITGTSSGLGQQLAQHYLAAGDLVIGCARRAASIDHPRYVHHLVDVKDESAIASMLAAVKADHQGLDVLINNAGVASMNAFALTPPAAMHDIVGTNLLGPMVLTHGAIRLLRKSTAGRIVNVTTVAVPLRLAGETVYAASKAALESFTRVLAKEVGAFGITCNAVGPSLTPTRLTNGLSPAVRERLLSQQAIARLGSAADVANVIDFFLRPESDLVTGQIVYLGGIS